MREIKFKGKRIDNGEWVYGNVIFKTSDAYSKRIDCGIQSDYCYPQEVGKETVGQFTGLKDKNGVEIYEGDIVSVCIYSYVKPLLGGNFEVVYSENRASFVFKHLEGNICYSSLDELTDINDFCTYEIEVIGNIHEVTP